MFHRASGASIPLGIYVGLRCGYRFVVGRDLYLARLLHYVYVGTYTAFMLSQSESTDVHRARLGFTDRRLVGSSIQYGTGMALYDLFVRQPWRWSAVARA